MPIRFRLLTEAEVKAVLTMDDLIETMTSALQRFSTGRVTQPVRSVISVKDDAFYATMPAFVRADSAHHDADFGGASPRVGGGAALGAKLVTVFGGNAARG